MKKTEEGKNGVVQCQGVVFDMDGVLFDSETLVLQCWELTAQRHHIPDITATCRKCLGTNAAASRQLFLETYGIDFPYDDYKKEMSALYWQCVKNGKLQVKPGVRELVMALHQNGWKVGIASSTRKCVIEQQLDIFGIKEYFDQIIGGDMVQQSKPAPDIYQRACRALQIMPKAAYAVEDSYHGIFAAYRAGMRPIMIPDLLPPTPEMEKMADHIFSDMQQFHRFLEETQGLGKGKTVHSTTSE